MKAQGKAQGKALKKIKKPLRTQLLSQSSRASTDWDADQTIEDQVKVLGLARVRITRPGRGNRYVK